MTTTQAAPSGKRPPMPKPVAANAATLATALAAINAAEAHLVRSFYERVDVVSCLLTCAIAGEHAALIGPPGTGKSALVRAFAGLFGASYFEYLMTRFTEPDELFGPVNLDRWKAGVRERAINGMLPCAEVAFLDEAFKANSAILNALLAVLNERKFYNPHPIEVPLRVCVMASNEYPEDAALEAMWDRAMVRINVPYLKEDDSKRALLFEPEVAVPKGIITTMHLHLVAEHARTLQWTQGAKDALLAIGLACVEKGVLVSDRRMKKCVWMVRCHAARLGATEVTDEHLVVLRHMLWSKPAHEANVGLILAKYAAPWLDEVRKINAGIDELKGKLPAIKMMPVNKRFGQLGALTSQAEDLKNLAEELVKKYPRPETTAVSARCDEVATAIVSLGRP